MPGNILVGITGGIAAYKMPACIRLLKKQGYAVRVVMTASAANFVTPMTLESVSGESVYQSMWDEDSMLHIELARWADVILIAPATANFIAKLAHGTADDLLSTICVTTTVPMLVAPAMNREMWAHDTTQYNLTLLQRRDITFVGPEQGLQACGEVGFGRLSEPDVVAEAIDEFLKSYNDTLQGVRVLITAGPTHEVIDTVRYLGNRSTGKMGYALAQAAHNMGAEVVLISGPTALIPPNVNVIPVVSANDMFESVMAQVSDCDIFISAAAVADYTPKTPSKTKLKKQPNNLTLEFERTRDILLKVGSLKNKPYCIGFAAEDESLIESAQKKRSSKNADMIVANYIQDSFAKDSNKVVIIDKNGSQELTQMSKSTLARMLLARVTSCYNA